MLDKLSVLLASVLPSSSDKGRKALEYRGEKCLNCELPLDRSDRYCPNCSQLNSTRKLHFRDFFNEFFTKIFAYDGKLIYTFRVLLFRPGVITKEFISGKRMQYANPFRFYLTVSIVFFLLIGLVNKIEGYKADKSYSSFEEMVDRDSFKEENTQLKNGNAIADSIVKQVYIKTGLAVADSIIREQPDFKDTAISNIPEKTIDSATLSAETKPGRFSSINEKITRFNNHYKENKGDSPKQALRKIGEEPSAYNLWLYKKLIDADFFVNNPDFTVDYFMSKLPFAIFFFIPLFALFIKLLYLRKKRFTYMEHLVFAFHVQSVFFVLMIFALVLNFLLRTDFFVSLFLLLFCFYLYKAMRKFYEQGRFKTIVKFVVLNTLFTILATFTAVVYAFLSFSIY